MLSLMIVAVGADEDADDDDSTDETPLFMLVIELIMFDEGEFDLDR